MKYEDRIIAFIDILGFKKHINNTLDNNGNDIQDSVKKLNIALFTIRDIFDLDNKMRRGFGIKRNEDLPINKKRITQFSDSIIISFKYNEESQVFFTLMDLLHLQADLLRFNILIRGGVCFGKIIHNNKVVFGPGLIRAYELESKAAIYPRIIMGEDIIKYGMEYRVKHHDPEEEKDFILSILSKDTDDMYYIDYFNSIESELNDPIYDMPNYILNIKEIIDDLGNIYSNNPDVEVKIGWMKNKFNKLLESYKSNKYLNYLKNEGEADLIKFYNDIKLY